MAQYSSTHANSRRLPFFLMAACALSLAAGALRLDSVSGLPGTLLWAEDGHVFIKGAMERGLGSVLEPHAGYLHVYARLVTYVATALGTSSIAYVMLAGWIFGYLLAQVLVARALHSYGLQPWAVMAAVVAIALAPTSGETLFTITNVQWHLGAALAVVVLIPIARAPTGPELLFIAIASLTGPFSAILLPLVALRVWWFRDAYARQRADVVLVVGALIQLSFFVDSDRVGMQATRDLAAWGQAFWAYLSFGSMTPAALGAAVFFWSLYLLGMLQRLRLGGWRDLDLRAAALFLAASLFFFLAGLYAVRDMPGAATPLGFGGRYFVIPYVLLFVSGAVLVRRDRWIGGALLLVVLAVGYLGWRSIERFDYGYDSYVDFAEARAGVFVPINPQFGDFHGGYRAATADAGLLTQSRDVATAEIAAEGRNEWFVSVSALGCPVNTRTLGLEAVFTLPKNAQIGVRWMGINDSGKAPVLYAGQGRTVHLALPWRLSGSRLRIRGTVLDGQPEQAQLRSLRAFCIASSR
jgi:hypothetical protein